MWNCLGRVKLSSHRHSVVRGVCAADSIISKPWACFDLSPGGESTTCRITGLDCYIILSLPLVNCSIAIITTWAARHYTLRVPSDRSNMSLIHTSSFQQLAIQLIVDYKLALLGQFDSSDPIGKLVRKF